MLTGIMEAKEAFVQKDKNPLVEYKMQISPAGYVFLGDRVTDVEGNIYAFNGKTSPLLIAAAMARLSRRGSDLREIFVDEFGMAGEKDASGLIHRVVTAYGDDSVQQLTGLHFVVEDASNLLTKMLEWGRFAAYLEQSTRYIYYDEKDKNGQYKYYVPADLDPETEAQYCRIHDQIFDLYSGMVHKLTRHVRKANPAPEDVREKIAWRGATKAQACDTIRPVLPVSTRSTVGIYASAQAVESLILHLLSEDLLEARLAGQKILEEARKVIPAFLERADKPDRGGATTAYRANTRAAMSKLAKKYLPKESKDFDSEVKLIDYWPKNESEIINHLLFAESNLSTAELEKAVRKLKKADKRRIFDTYMGKRLNRRHRPGRALEFPHYLWEVTADYGTFRDLQRHRVIDGFEWQDLSTAYGYEVPELVREAGLEQDFHKCFELSEELHQLMLQKKYVEEAQYATLFGHRMRYRFMLNARATFHFLELRSSPQGHPGYRRICMQMHEQLKKVHPMLASAMRFVNQDEDPKLTRMAAELATQYKLEKLDNLEKQAEAEMEKNQ
ncbi:MAG TPA: FAD-dependent thymidylate synthase [Candidatus Saccharimonadales bacterium]|nr:FAD-dependent thymidylate synthase [Candidatus Saccharimonadales bacterium]